MSKVGLAANRTSHIVWLGAALLFTLVGIRELYCIAWQGRKAWNRSQHAGQLLHLVPARLCHDSLWHPV